MSRKSGYSKQRMKTGKRVKDFLPPPEKLAFKKESVNLKTARETSPK